MEDVNLATSHYCRLRLMTLRHVCLGELYFRLSQMYFRHDEVFSDILEAELYFNHNKDAELLSPKGPVS